jgi:hypothetical protein
MDLSIDQTIDLRGLHFRCRFRDIQAFGYDLSSTHVSSDHK